MAQFHVDIYFISRYVLADLTDMVPGEPVAGWNQWLNLSIRINFTLSTLSIASISSQKICAQVIEKILGDLI
jgi:hypothetical protein